MSPCLIHQLFRQKIGQELDQHLVDDVLFPMLRSRKHPSKTLIQDIKLTSGILVTTEPWRPLASNQVDVLPFTEKTEYWDYMEQSARHVGGRGRHTSKFRRKKIGRADWGTIDILNKLRGLNYPQMGYRPPYFEEETCGEDEFDDAYIRLEEDNSLPPDSWSVAQRCQNRIAREGRSQFVNNFLDDVLLTDKRLTWGAIAADPVGGILSVVDTSRYGEVQNQFY